jgi:ABC-2 type transport system ATP-binding protein
MITLDSVTRKYGDFTAVDDVSFSAQPGRVTGFLGPNGAGKSTTMRIIVGLTHATTGTAIVSGRHYVDLPNPGREVGVLLDASAQHAGRTGREILTIAQRYMGLPKARVEEMLDRVGRLSVCIRTDPAARIAMASDAAAVHTSQPVQCSWTP